MRVSTRVPASHVPAKVVATCFALVSFSAALGVGMRAGNATHTILWRATALMLVAWCVGRIVGGVALRTIEEPLTQYREKHPIPTDPDESGAAPDAAEAGGEGGVSMTHEVPEAAPQNG